MKIQDEKIQAELVKSRHSMLSTIFVSFFMFATISSMVGGCTYYNVETLKHPVDHEVNHNESYKRGDK